MLKFLVVLRDLISCSKTQSMQTVNWVLKANSIFNLGLLLIVALWPFWVWVVPALHSPPCGECKKSATNADCTGISFWANLLANQTSCLFMCTNNKHVTYRFTNNMILFQQRLQKWLLSQLGKWNTVSRTIMLIRAANSQGSFSSIDAKIFQVCNQQEKVFLLSRQESIKCRNTTGFLRYVVFQDGPVAFTPLPPLFIFPLPIICYSIKYGRPSEWNDPWLSSY